MMKLYSVYDSVANTWQPTVALRNDNEAVRGFKLSCSDPRIPETYLSDIKLFCVGTFDETNGIVEGYTSGNYTARFVIAGNDFLILRDRVSAQEVEVHENEIFKEENND